MKTYLPRSRRMNAPLIPGRIMAMIATLPAKKMKR